MSDELGANQDPEDPSVGRRPWRRSALGWAALVLVAVIAPTAVVGVGRDAEEASTATTAPADPVDADSFPDPGIAWDGSGYVMATTQQGQQNVPFWTSPDTVEWEMGGDLLPELPEWASAGQTWSPALHRRDDGVWVLHAATTNRSTGTQCILAATAATARGPFVAEPEPVVCEAEMGGSIDPFVAVVDGVPYLYWSTNGAAIGQPMTVRAGRLSQDLTTLEGPATEVLAPTEAWQGTMVSSPSVVLGPSGSVHLVYSGGEWAGPDYAVGTASCPGPAQRCEPDADGPAVIAGAVPGTAGAKPFVDAGGSLVLALHAPGSGGIAVGGRELVLADVDVVGGVPMLTARP